jgi:hypothetical protein
MTPNEIIVDAYEPRGKIVLRREGVKYAIPHPDGSSFGISRKGFSMIWPSCVQTDLNVQCVGFLQNIMNLTKFSLQILTCSRGNLKARVNQRLSRVSRTLTSLLDYIDI